MVDLITNRLSVVYLPKDEDVAKRFVDATRKRFPELSIEEIILAKQKSQEPSGTTVAFLFDATFDTDEAGKRWLSEWPENRGSVPVMPVALDAQSQKPPDPVGGIKSRVWPDDSQEILTTIGASLGMAFRPGKRQLFISYRQQDGTDAARRINEHFTSLGFNTFLDVANDRYDDPQLEIGSDVQDEIMMHLSNASAMIQIDTPSAPNSRWVRAEIEGAVGQMIPILPVVFHDNSVNTHKSRFRELNDLFRRIVIQGDIQGTQFQVKDEQLSDIATELTKYLLKIYMRRVIQPRLLERAFTTNNWDFESNPDKPHLHQANLTPPPVVPVSLLGCCSFEDFFFAPTCRSFLTDITDLANLKKNFLRSLYFYDGQLLYDQDLRYIVENEIVELQSGNVNLVHYDEAVAQILRITGGLNGIFA